MNIKKSCERNLKIFLKGAELRGILMWWEGEEEILNENLRDGKSDS
jgi:hypothetical protein